MNNVPHLMGHFLQPLRNHPYITISSFRIRFVGNPAALATQKSPIFAGAGFYAFFVQETER